MKLKILILTLAVCGFFTASAQFVTQSLGGGPGIKNTVRGALKPDSGLVVLAFPDTLTANKGPNIKKEHGLLILVGDTIYFRNTARSQWVPIKGFGSTVIAQPGSGIDSIRINPYEITFYMNTPDTIIVVPLDSAITFGQLSEDSMFQNYYARGVLKFQIPTLLKGLMGADSCITIRDTTFNRLAIYFNPNCGGGASQPAITWSVLDSLSTPVVSPADGDKYLVGTSPTGAFVTHTNQIASWDSTGATYTFESASTGDLLYNAGLNVVDRWNGAAWVRVTVTTINNWTTSGNIAPYPRFIGTIDNSPLVFKTFNTPRGGFDSTSQGRFYVGKSTETGRTYSWIDSTTFGTFKTGTYNMTIGTTGTNVWSFGNAGVAMARITSGAVQATNFNATTVSSGNYLTNYEPLTLQGGNYNGGTIETILLKGEFGTNKTRAIIYDNASTGAPISLLPTDGNLIVGSNNTSDVPTGLVNMVSTSKGLLVPRMTAAQRILISLPATGLMVFDTDSASHFQYTGSAWQNMRGAGGGGSTTTASNGLYKYGNDIQFGGDFTKNDTLNLKGYNFFIRDTSDGANLNYILQSATGTLSASSFQLNRNQASLSNQYNDVGGTKVSSFTVGLDSIYFSVNQGSVGNPNNHFSIRRDFSQTDKPIYLKDVLGGSAVEILPNSFENGQVNVKDSIGGKTTAIIPSGIQFSNYAGTDKFSSLISGVNYDGQSSYLYTPINALDTIAIGVEVNGITYKTDTLGIVRLGTISGGGGWAYQDTIASLTGNGTVYLNNNNLLFTSTNGTSLLLNSIDSLVSLSTPIGRGFYTSDQNLSAQIYESGSNFIYLNGSDTTIDFISDTFHFQGKIKYDSPLTGASTDSVLTWDATTKEVRMRNASAFLTASSYVFNETPSGTINSSNVTFTIANTPTAGTVQVWVSGIRQKLTTHYSISGTTITFVTAPTTGSDLIVDYLK